MTAQQARGRRAAIITVALVAPLLTGACAGGGSTSADAAVTVPTSAPSPSTSGTGEPVRPARRAASVLQARPPTRLTLPSGRDVPVAAVDTTRAGLLDVPGDVEVAGWWRGGSRLGDPFGSILVAAHVDSRTQGLGPFAELLTAARGSRLEVVAPGLRQTFAVRSRRLVPQGTLGDEPWVSDPSGPLRLTLVTCAPPYDAARGGYQNLAVLVARPTGPPEVS